MSSAHDQSTYHTDIDVERPVEEEGGFKPELLEVKRQVLRNIDFWEKHD